jgi:hypothetical protein
VGFSRAGFWVKGFEERAEEERSKEYPCRKGALSRKKKKRPFLSKAKRSKRCLLLRSAPHDGRNKSEMISPN